MNHNARRRANGSVKRERTAAESKYNEETFTNKADFMERYQALKVAYYGVVKDSMSENGRTIYRVRWPR